MNGSSIEAMGDDEEALDPFRQSIDIVVVYCIAYGIVFVVGLVGNLFVLLAVVKYPNMHSITNYLICNLAVADLLIIVFCLPSTLMVNVLTEWYMGDVMCRLSTWVNGTTTCTSVYTLVTVTADRYCSICHTMKYNVIEKRKTFLAIVPTWIASGLLFSPSLINYKQVIYTVPNTTLTVNLCREQFDNPLTGQILFVVVNIIIAYLVPLVVITVCYTYIFVTVFRHISLAVDRGATEREHKMKMRVTNMMLVVIISFAFSWLPLYSLYIYFNFANPNQDSTAFYVATNFLRPISQWLALANSSINPICYAYFSLKFRAAFQQLLVMPCRRKYDVVRNVTRSTIDRYSTIRRINSSHSSTAAASLAVVNNAIAHRPIRDNKNGTQSIPINRYKLSLPNASSDYTALLKEHNNGKRRLGDKHRLASIASCSPYAPPSPAASQLTVDTPLVNNNNDNNINIPKEQTLTSSLLVKGAIADVVDHNGAPNSNCSRCTAVDPPAKPQPLTETNVEEDQVNEGECNNRNFNEMKELIANEVRRIRLQHVTHI